MEPGTGTERKKTRPSGSERAGVVEAERVSWYNNGADYDWANARKRSRWNSRTGGDGMTTVELFFGLIAIASLVLTIYFGMRR